MNNENNENEAREKVTRCNQSGAERRCEPKREDEKITPKRRKEALGEKGKEFPRRIRSRSIP